MKNNKCRFPTGNPPLFWVGSTRVILRSEALPDSAVAPADVSGTQGQRVGLRPGLNQLEASGRFARAKSWRSPPTRGISTARNLRFEILRSCREMVYYVWIGKDRKSNG
jgi:hypothetical protein